VKNFQQWNECEYIKKYIDNRGSSEILTDDIHFYYHKVINRQIEKIGEYFI